MASDGEEINTTDQDLSTHLVEIIKEFPILIEKCQLPQAKEKKTLALQQAKNTIMASIGKRMDEKQIMKKIANMKTSLKKKTDTNQTGNRKITLCPWEKELYTIMNGDENPVVTKMPCSISAGVSTNTDSLSSCSSQASPSAPCPRVGKWTISNDKSYQ